MISYHDVCTWLLGDCIWLSSKYAYQNTELIKSL